MAMSFKETDGLGGELSWSEVPPVVMARSSTDAEWGSVRFLWSAGEAGECAGLFLDVSRGGAVEDVYSLLVDAVRVVGGVRGVVRVGRGRGGAGATNSVSSGSGAKGASVSVSVSMSAKDAKRLCVGTVVAGSVLELTASEQQVVVVLRVKLCM